MTRQEFKLLIEKEGNSIYSFSYHLTGNREDADDLYQETMLKAMERCSKIDSSKNPKSFLISIAVGNWKNRKKKYANRERIAPTVVIDDLNQMEVKQIGLSPEEEYLSKEIINLVRVETAALKEKYRILLYLHYTAELSVDEISKMIHIPVGTVKSRLHKARTIIGKKLEDYGYGN